MAALEILALDTVTPQIEAPQAGDTYSAPRAISITPESLTGSAATTSLNVAQTWNTSGTPTAVKLNVTDTASNAASLLMDLQVGGTSKFSVDKSGKVTFTTTGNLYATSSNISIVDGSSVAQINFNTQSANGLRVASDRPIGFTSGSANGSAPDVTLRRVAAGILGVRSGAITDAGALSFIEQTAPAAPATNGVYIYAQDNGAGKTQLMARFATGAAVQIAIEP